MVNTKELWLRSWFICSKWYILVSWCIWELYESWNIWTQPSSFFSEPGLVWQTASKKMKVKLGLDQLTNIGMLLMVEKKYLKWNMSHCLSICETNSKYMQIYDENKELPCLKYWDVNNFLDGQCLGGCLWRCPKWF